ncbi:ribonuclease, Rne/Rng family (plasmid) [Ruegeria pomeroyi DSS-3]|jgi:Ribonuclease G/E|uniref:Ribonuclease, Rne/Rng family n=2 Tax=Ruegeria pomeroyi TaxID=89184 RepID=Q5LLE8_RUEPO|nr:ribonuclease E/G [Ruegeria pomeroyi]AAV97218.1 ribonuclease, Rne/Rng family [Ruegeria pomeroyi DSS-3]NVK95615.1 ribonuclease E/G [Ruegeria pomeroyi]NVL00326.1 ribonuclease E/G [Ruegeria pomeroyi]
MKGRTIVLDHIAGREAAALMVDGQLDDFLIASDAPPPGTIYRARADRPVKGQGGMFLTTPDGPAFLRQVKGLAPGAHLLVQVTGYAEPGKAIPVTAKLLFKSRYAIVTPGAPGLNLSRNIRDEAERDRLLEIAHEEMEGHGFGLILRSSCAEVEGEVIAEDIAAMIAQAQQVLEDDGKDCETLIEGDGPHVLAWRDWTDPAEVVTAAGGFEDHGVLDALERVRGIAEPLPGGGHLYIQPTRALVAVDVNTGSDTSLAAGQKANFACAKLLPRVLRIRGLGGQITLDLAPMAKKDRRGFEAALRAALKADSEETTLAGWTPLGHYELQRKRGRVPVAEALS